MTPVYFFHGLEGSPQGIKGQFFKSRVPGILIPAMPKNLFERIEQVRASVKEPSLLIGSSLGGLTALLFALEQPHLVLGLVLVAPAVGFYDPSLGTQEELAKLHTLSLPQNIPIEILAAKDDEIIPLSSIENLVYKSPKARVNFIVLEGGHSMNAHLEQLALAYHRVLHAVG